MATQERPESACCPPLRSEEHTSELQSQPNLVCRLLLEKKNRGHHRNFFERISEHAWIAMRRSARHTNEAKGSHVRGSGGRTYARTLGLKRKFRHHRILGGFHTGAVVPTIESRR